MGRDGVEDEQVRQSIPDGSHAVGDVRRLDRRAGNLKLGENGQTALHRALRAAFRVVEARGDRGLVRRTRLRPKQIEFVDLL